MRRLEEVLRQMCSAAKAIGNTELENKFAEGKNHHTSSLTITASLLHVDVHVWIIFETKH